jgi:hypothetical protein
MPITHTQPDDPAAGVEIPQPLKKQLGLDMERSWIRVDAANSFEWPGHDLRQIPDSPGEFAYGHLPPNFYGRVVEGFNEYKKDKRRKTVTVDRDDIQVTI